MVPHSLPESDGHRDHGGIGGTKNKKNSRRIPAFNAVKSCICVWWPQIGHFCTTFPRNRGFEGFEKINHHQIGTPTCIKKVTKIKKFIKIKTSNTVSICIIL